MSDEDFEPFVGGPPPDPSERTWRHPSEVAAQAQQEAALALAGSPRGARSILGWRPANPANLLIAGSLSAAVCLAAVAVFQATRASEPPVPAGSLEVAAPIDTSASVSIDLGDASAAIGLSSSSNESPSTTTALATSVIPIPVVSPAAAAVADDQLVAIIAGREPVANGVLVDGYLITSASAVGDTLSVSYRFGGELMLAYMVGIDPFSDLAVFRPSTEFQAGRTLQALTTGLADGTPSGETTFAESIESGDVVMSVTLTDEGIDTAVGVVLAMGSGGVTNDGQTLIELVDTTLRQPHHAGSALLDTDGRLIGIIVDTDNSLASAVAVRDAVAIADRLSQQGWASETWIGFMGIDVAGGVEVVDVTADGPAEVAGLVPGDIIRFLDGASIQHMGGVTAGLRRAEPGDVVVVLVERGAEMVALRVEAARYPSGEVSEPVGG